MIDKRELLEKARELRLSFLIVEKDYVLGWLLYGMKDFDELAFKGGTALSKIYFPKMWRLSEDLDFAFTGNDFSKISGRMSDVLDKISRESLVKFRIKSEFSNPLYLQLKIGYDAVFGKNWIKVDVTKEPVLDCIEKKKQKKRYSDHPEFCVNVESIEEIFSEKIRSLIERTKCRDYFDVWKLCSLDFDKGKVLKLFRKKCEIKGIRFSGVEQIFPFDIESALSPYWIQELGRLLKPLPDLHSVLEDLKAMLKFLES
ncbi:nucleotidyl transferase AbiEii/AbiGii toxin family protein [candidate division KSB1 bacterium]|nr:nucleotidyl transferase AbiEii/AbiGii toxin family protein [candidate division KSB1 bacterium]